MTTLIIIWVIGVVFFAGLDWFFNGVWKEGKMKSLLTYLGWPVMVILRLWNSKSKSAGIILGVLGTIVVAIIIYKILEMLIQYSTTGHL